MPFNLITKNGTIRTNIGRHNDKMGEAILYMLIICKKKGLLLRCLANAQSTYKYFSQKPVSAFISSHNPAILFNSKLPKLCLLFIVFNSSACKDLMSCWVFFR